MWNNINNARLKAESAAQARDWLNATQISSSRSSIVRWSYRIDRGYGFGSHTYHFHTFLCSTHVDGRDLHGFACKKSGPKHICHAMVNNRIWRAKSPKKAQYRLSSSQWAVPRRCQMSRRCNADNLGPVANRCIISYYLAQPCISQHHLTPPDIMLHYPASSRKSPHYPATFTIPHNRAPPAYSEPFSDTPPPLATARDNYIFI